MVPDDILRGVRMGDGTIVARDALFVPPRFVPNDELLVGLGCAHDAHGWVDADPTGRTSVPGLWVAGNVVDPRAQVIVPVRPVDRLRGVHAGPDARGYDETGSTTKAIELGLARTGNLVTSAALILMLAFLVLSSNPGYEEAGTRTGHGARPVTGRAGRPTVCRCGPPPLRRRRST